MTDLDKRITVELQCSPLYSDFLYYIDNREYEKVVAMFLDDGSFDRLGHVLKGKEEILKFLNSRPTDVATHHICTNVRIEPRDDGTATGTCSVLLFRSTPGSEAQPSPVVARYCDALVLTDEGWRIKERVAQLVFG